MWLIAAIMTTALAWTSAPNANDWTVVNDTVMGGVSQATVTDHPQGGVVFSGTLSLANNGGFASTRTAAIPDDWSGVSAIAMRVQGDGRRYIATVRINNRSMRRIYYRQAFDTDPEAATDVVLPLDGFEAYTFGRRVPGAPSLREVSAQIGSVGIMLADKQPGSFEIRIDSLATELGEPPAETEALEPVSIAVALQQAIETGVPLYNAGRADRCGDVYETAITSILLLAPDQLSEAQQSRLIGALQAARRDDSASARAWTLRRAIDATMLSMNTGD